MMVLWFDDDGWIVVEWFVVGGVDEFVVVLLVDEVKHE